MAGSDTQHHYYKSHSRDKKLSGESGDTLHKGLLAELTSPQTFSSHQERTNMRGLPGPTAHPSGFVFCWSPVSHVLPSSNTQSPPGHAGNPGQGLPVSFQAQQTGCTRACQSTFQIGFRQYLEHPAPFSFLSNPIHRMQMISTSAQMIPPELSGSCPRKLGCSVQSRKSFKMYY